MNVSGADLKKIILKRLSFFLDSIWYHLMLPMIKCVSLQMGKICYFSIVSSKREKKAEAEICRWNTESRIIMRYHFMLGSIWNLTIFSVSKATEPFVPWIISRYHVNICPWSSVTGSYSLSKVVTLGKSIRSLSSPHFVLLGSWWVRWVIGTAVSFQKLVMWRYAY